ncbi:MAG: tRNA 2-thiouridine(34) synthase MnmA [bacterium]
MQAQNSAKVLVGMSGGVDSSASAALLRDQGYEVAGLSLNLVTCHRAKERSCCSAQDRSDAREVCSQLKCAYSVLDCRARFRELVIDPFVDEYLAGRTPSPCIRCNELVKFPTLCQEADRQGIHYIATGHYARVVKHGEIYRLLRGLDAAKDQSYFLFSLTQRELSRLIFPLGGMRKQEVREYAAQLSLYTREKAESQEICFVPDDDCAGFIEERAGGRISGPGEFVGTDGSVVGRHRGTHAYTIGQRRGLGLARGRRMYVVAIERERNRVVLGEDADLMRDELTASGVSWTDPSNAGERDAIVKIRSTHAGVPAKIEIKGQGRVRVKFEEPVRAIAPGQAAVFYRGDEILGGGWIEKSEILNSKS